MSREDDRRSFRNLFDILDKNHPSFLETTHDPFVVDDGVSHVQRRPMNLEGEVYDLNGEGYASAEPTRSRKDDLFHPPIVPKEAAKTR